MDSVTTDLAEALPAIRLVLDSPVAGAVIGKGVRLTGFGWAVARAGVAEIFVSVGEKLICYATYGLYRPNIEPGYADYPNSDHSGFSFATNADLPSGEMFELTVTVRAMDGQEFRQSIPISTAAQSDGVSSLNKPAGARMAPMQLCVDKASVDHHGILRIHGWAVSLSPLFGVRIFFDDEKLGIAKIGEAREDIALAWPDYPNAGASGFSFALDVSSRLSGAHKVKIQAVARGGIARDVIAPVEAPRDLQAQPQLADGTVHYSCDDLILTGLGGVTVTGWAASQPGMDQVAILLDDVEIGLAELGGDRPDVGNIYPSIPMARQSGFAFRAKLGQAFEGEHLITLRLRNRDGNVRSVPLPVLATATQAVQLDNVPVASDSNDLRLHLDEPVLLGGAVPDPIRGSMTLNGWALARDGVDIIECWLDGISLGAAFHGMGRPDIAIAFPGMPGALLSGYGLSIPGKTLTPGDHRIKLELRDKKGARKAIEFQLTAEEMPDTGGPASLRRKITAAEIASQKQILAGLAWRPTVSLLLPMGQGDIGRTRATIESLSRQAYQDWRLRIVPPARCDADALRTALIDGFDTIASRVSMVPRDAGLALADPAIAGTGDANLVGVIKARDLLGCDATLEMAMASGLNGKADLFYSDERRIDPAGGNLDAYFKPDWSPDLLLSSNYIGRLWLVRSALLRRVAVTVGELIRYGEYDVVLRLAEAAKTIHHLPKVLCEREAEALDGAVAEKRALSRAMARRHIKAEILPGCLPGIYRVKRAVETEGLVSIIIPTCAARGMIETCIQSIRNKTRYRNFEIVCIENIPPEQQSWREWLRRNADKVISTTKSFNWSRFNNLAAAAANKKAEFFLFLNDDVEIIDPDWLDALLEHAQRPEVGVVGPQLLYPDRKVQHAGLFLSGIGLARHAFRFANEDEPGAFGRALTQRNMIGVTGACMMVRRKAFQALSGFDEQHSVVNNDLDYCLRVLRAGQLVVFTPHTKLIHHELVSRAAIEDIYDRTHFDSVWREMSLKGDPYFSPFLSVFRDDYAHDAEPISIVHAGHPLIERDQVRNILVVKLDHIGDVITAFPALQRLRRNFPNAKIHLLGAKATAAFVSLEPSIDEFIEFNFFHARSGAGQHQLAEEDLLALKARLTPYRFDLAIDLRKHFDTRYILQYTGAQFTAGFDFEGRYPWLDIALEWEGDPRFGSKRHYVGDDFIHLVEAVTNSCEPNRQIMSPDMIANWPMPTLPGAAGRLLFRKRVVAIHPASGTAMRQWPPEYFADLINLLVGECDVQIALIGGADEADIITAVLDKVHDRKAVFSLAGKLPLKDLPKLLAACALFVGNNSGPKHIAAALGVPTIGVHSGVIDSAEWAPMGPSAVAIRRDMTCSPCYLSKMSDCHRGLACLVQISAGEVFRICEKMLAIGRGLTRLTQNKKLPIVRRLKVY